MKKTIKAWIKKWLFDEATEFTPKKERDLRAVCFSSKSPIDGKHYEETYCHCTEWNNGEGHIFAIDRYNQKTKKTEKMSFELHYDDVDLIIACLNDLGRF